MCFDGWEDGLDTNGFLGGGFEEDMLGRF